MKEEGASPNLKPAEPLKRDCVVIDMEPTETDRRRPSEERRSRSRQVPTGETGVEGETASGGADDAMRTTTTPSQVV